MNSYFFLLAIIAALAVLNLSTLVWVGSLQRKLRRAGKSGRGAKLPSVADLGRAGTEDASAYFEAAVAQAAKTMHQDLTATSLQINQQFKELAETYTKRELEEYHKTLVQFRDAANNSLSQLQQTVDQERSTLTGQVRQEIASYRNRLLKQFESRLADVVSSYLIEALGTNADLGAQSQYLFTMLDQHKAELKRDIEHELSAS